MIGTNIRCAHLFIYFVDTRSCPLDRAININTPYRPQANSVLEQVRSTMQNMVAIFCCEVAHDDWAQRLP